LSKKIRVRVPTDIVRNEGVYLSNQDFLLYSRLCFLYFRNYQEEELQLDHRKLMYKLNIYDTRTLKKRLHNLYDAGLIHNKIDTFPKRKPLSIIMNGSKIKKSKHFTQINAEIFDKIEEINEHSFRLLFYYKSHINLSDKKKDRSYCFVGYDTLSKRLKMGRDTISTANTLLKKNKIIHIEKHSLSHDDSYDENDELIYDRYNNHYRIREDWI